MNLSALSCLLSVYIVHSEAKYRLDINRIKDIIQRRNLFDRSKGVILGIPKHPEDLPEAEPILPGHTLLRPSMGMLKSSVKFPHRDYGGAAVYGNMDNLGITYGNTNQRILYTNFRKANDLLSQITKMARDLNGNRDGEKSPAVVLISTPTKLKELARQYPENKLAEVSEEENNASEVSDDLDALLEDSDDEEDFRRGGHKKHSKTSKKYSSSDDSSDTSTSSEIDDNPGNPYTLFKNKYKQNWLWKHDMDGDHMNVNPYAPKFNNLDPAGTELFFGRKWWYFNQDDFKPMG